MKNKLTKLQAQLQHAPAILAGKKVAAGFDGFIDAIVKVINYKTDTEGPVYFKTISEFGDYISGKSGSGFSLESDELMQKMGGNMPIMANAIAQMGAYVNCIGAFGVPGIAPAFLHMHPNCQKHSYTNPGFTTAMEFTDGKIMLAQMTDLNHANWDTIKNAVGLHKLKDIFTEASLICLVNWSELDNSNHIWEGLLNDIFASTPLQKKDFFFDLSDCSKRRPEAVTGAIRLMKQFSNYGRVTLSLNGNEAKLLYQTLIHEHPPEKLQVIGEKLFSALKIDTLIIHSSKIAAAWNANGTYHSTPLYIPDPKISTGAGDNFNAGYCMALLTGLNADLALLIANSVAHCYITTSISPDMAALNAHLAQLITTG